MWINTLIAILLLGLWAAPVSEGRGLLGRLRPPVGGLLLRRCPPPSTCKLAGLVQASAQDGLLAPTPQPRVWHKDAGRRRDGRSLRASLREWGHFNWVPMTEIPPPWFDERNPAAGELRRGKGSKMKKETLNIYEKPEGNKPTR